MLFFFWKSSDWTKNFFFFVSPVLLKLNTFWAAARYGTQMRCRMSRNKISSKSRAVKCTCSHVLCIWLKVIVRVDLRSTTTTTCERRSRENSDRHLAASAHARRVKTGTDVCSCAWCMAFFSWLIEWCMTLTEGAYRIYMGPTVHGHLVKRPALRSGWFGPGTK